MKCCIFFEGLNQVFLAWFLRTLGDFGLTILGLLGIIIFSAMGTFLSESSDSLSLFGGF